MSYLRRLYAARVLWFQRRKRKEPPFRLYVGRRGRGKSLLLTRDCQRELSRGSLVLSNFPVYDPYSERYADNWYSVIQLMESVAAAVMRGESRIVIAVDEAQNHFDARDWQNTPRWFRQFLAESRHYHCGVFAATQSITQVDKRFRILCDEVIRVRPVLEGFHHRFAVYRCCELLEDHDSSDEEAKELGMPWLTYVSARAYGGYSTAALPTEDDFAGGDSLAIEALLAQSREYVSQGDIGTV